MEGYILLGKGPRTVTYGRVGWRHDLNVMLLEVSQRRGNISQDTGNTPLLPSPEGTLSVCRYSRCTFYVQQGDMNAIPRSNTYTMEYYMYIVHTQVYVCTCECVCVVFIVMEHVFLRG